MKVHDRTPFLSAPVRGHTPTAPESFILVVKGTFSLKEAGPCTIAEPQIPFSGDLFRDDELDRDCLYDGDFAPFKPKTDLLLVGRCYAPGGKPLSACVVTFGVGRWSKSLRVTAPEPFVSLPLDYARAFGGPGHRHNPVGSERPSIEYPDGRREPAGFGPISRLWPQRTSKTGTYDKEWLQERWPRYPDDFDWTYFNAAPVDQQLAGYLRGDEEISLENLHPEHPRFQTRLPGVRVRSFLREHDRVREVPMNLDTLIVDTEKRVLLLLWRGVAETRTEEGDEISDWLIVSEPLSQAPAPAESYRPLLSESKKEASPEKPASEAPEPPLEEDPEFQAAQQAAAEAQDDLKQDLRAEGVDLDAVAARPAAPWSREEARKKLLAPREELVAEKIAVPPALDAEIAALENDEIYKEIEEDLQTGETDATWTREKCRAHLAAGGGFAKEDLSGVDLSGLDLSGVDFQETILKAADLSKAKLVKTNLPGAVLEGANLAEADLTEANLVGCDAVKASFRGAILRGARLEGGDFSQADLSQAILQEAKGKSALFRGTLLPDAKMGKGDWTSTDFSGANLERCDFADAMLASASIEGAQAQGVGMRRADLSRLRASNGTDLRNGSFIGVTADGSMWVGARLDGADFTGSKLKRSDFSSASLCGARLDAADLRHACFANAVLESARLFRVNLFKGSLEKARLTGADFRESNLYEVEFWNAVTEGADFEDANLKRTKLS